MGRLHVLRRAHEQTLAFFALGHHLPQEYIVMVGLELLLWGLWMARGQLFLANQLMPWAGTASETT